MIDTRHSVLWCIVSLLFADAADAQTRRPPVIDMHLHSYTNIFADERFCFPQPCEPPPSRVTDPGELRSAALAEMDRYNVVLAVVSGARDEVLRWTEGSQERFITGIQIGRPR
jgi:hypothetical protein